MDKTMGINFQIKGCRPNLVAQTLLTMYIYFFNLIDLMFIGETILLKSYLST